MRTQSQLGWAMLQYLAVTVLGHQVAQDPELVRKLERRRAR